MSFAQTSPWKPWQNARLTTFANRTAEHAFRIRCLSHVEREAGGQCRGPGVGGATWTWQGRHGCGAAVQVNQLVKLRAGALHSEGLQACKGRRWCSHRRKQHGGSSPPNEQQPTPLLGGNPRRVKSPSQSEPCPRTHGSSVHGSQGLEHLSAHGGWTPRRRGTYNGWYVCITV